MAKAPPIRNFKVLKRTDQTHDAFELTFERSAAEIPFIPGQFISIIIPGAGPGGRDLRRAYSVASPPESENFELSIKLVEGGPGTTYLNSLKVGDEIKGQMPMGDFIMKHPEDAPTFFIGTGTGIAPYRSMILSSTYYGPRMGAKVGFLLGVRAENDILYPELFTSAKPKALQNTPHAKICLSRPLNPSSWQDTPYGFTGRVTDYLKEMARQEETGKEVWPWKETHYYLCGSGPMIQEVMEWLKTSQGVDVTHLHKEAYFK